MVRFRFVGLAVLAAIASSAMVASAAQAVTAPYFTIGGTRLVAGKTHNFDAKAYRSFAMSLPGLGITVTCTGLNTEKAVLLGSNVGAPGKDDEVFVLTGCTQAGDGAECTVKNPIRTTPLVSTQVENETNRNQLLEWFEPAVGATFLTIEFEGNCTLESATARGTVVAEVRTDSSTEEKIELGQTPKEATSWLLKFPNPAIPAVLEVNGKGEHETDEVEFEIASVPGIWSGTALTLLANTKFEPERAALWSPLP